VARIAAVSLDDSRGADGFHHPSSEEELAGLVKMAYNEERQLRVRGAVHSVSHAIYTDPIGASANRVSRQEPPPGANVNVMLDRYRGWRVLDESRKLVEADAGIHLGDDPGDPTGSATLETSLLWQLATEKQWGLWDTGGVTHQTVSGFTATGSSGGSLQFTSNKNLVGFRVIDGRGDIHDLSRDGPDQDLFYSMSPSMGLLGVVSKIRFECVDDFAIGGHEAITPLASCEADLFGSGSPGRPPLEQFLRNAEFARLEWWPQRGAERIVTWQCRRLAPEPGFEPNPYERFGDHPEVTQQLVSILYTVLANLDDLSRTKARLEDNFDHLEDVLKLVAETKGLGAAGKALAGFLSHAIEFGVDAAITVLEPMAPVIRRTLPDFLPRLLGSFIPFDSDKKGQSKGEPQHFSDWAWHGLPMDNQASDVLMPTGFTEAWVPLPRTQEVMQLLNGYFTEPTDEDEAYRRTGTYAWELYSAMPTRFWLNPSYTSGSDEWKHGAFRIDPYWFADRPDDPAVTFFSGLWDLLRDKDIPFRLHWGKYQPLYPRGDRGWVDFFKAQYPRWDDFLSLRAERDPKGIFLTDYWRDRFGLWD
jgi:hypothetical protein